MSLLCLCVKNAYYEVDRLNQAGVPQWMKLGYLYMCFDVLPMAGTDGSISYSNMGRFIDPNTGQGVNVIPTKVFREIYWTVPVNAAKLAHPMYNGMLRPPVPVGPIELWERPKEMSAVPAVVKCTCTNAILFSSGCKCGKLRQEMEKEGRTFNKVMGFWEKKGCHCK